MSKNATHRTSNDRPLLAAALALGVLIAAAYAAFRAITEQADGASGHWATFGETMLFPGSIVIVAVAAVVWLGWKANIDG